LLSEVAAARERLHRHFGDIAEVVIAERRYGFISGACQEAVESTTELRHSASDRIDEIVTNRIVGLPIFLVLMYALFKVTFTLGAIPMDWLEHFFSWLGRTVSACWPWDGGGALRSLVVDGAIAGVGGVLVFVPNVVFLFAGIAFLEDSGYMARGAFLTDRLMHRIGLHGRSFIPMVLGFGCSVPAILATRTLGNRRDRMATLLVLPLISCGARFPIYALFAAAFFPAEWRARVIMMLYLLGIALAALLAKLLRATLFRGDTTLFVMELPPYRVPTFRAIWSHTWERLRLFLRKAATVIVAASVLLWFLTNYPKPDLSATHGLAPAEARAAELAASAAGRIGHALEPAMRHVGFDWRTTTALIGAVAAKEIFVAQLGILFSQGEGDARSESLRRALQEHYNPLQAFCIMLFCLISVPCVATLGATGAETGAWRWAFLQFAGLTLLAYGVTFVVYQAGMVLGVGVG
jgi:ferrous iron transport protein B